MIRIDNLCRSFGSVKALDGISLTIQRGEILGFLGPNGAGKTTTLRILTGYMAPTAGSITINERPVGENAAEVKGLIGYLPESAPLYGDMLVYDYLRFIAAAKDVPRADQEEALRSAAALCGIREVMHKPIHQLSKGYRQRVGLAQALTGDPEILVLDEPTSGLDPNQIAEIRTIIRRIGETKTIIFSTHILSEAEAVCDRVVIINGGRIVADGPAAELRERSADAAGLCLSLDGAEREEALDLIGAIPGISAVSVAGETPFLTLHITTTGDRRREIYRTVKQKEWDLLDFHRQTKSLEHIFRELTLTEREV